MYLRCYFKRASIRSASVTKLMHAIPIPTNAHDRNQAGTSQKGVEYHLHLIKFLHVSAYNLIVLFESKNTIRLDYRSWTPCSTLISLYTEIANDIIGCH